LSSSVTSLDLTALSVSVTNGSFVSGVTNVLNIVYLGAGYVDVTIINQYTSVVSLPVNYDMLLDRNAFTLSGGNITTWLDASANAINFVNSSVASSSATVDGTGGAVFGTGHCLTTTSDLAAGASYSDLSVFVRFKHASLPTSVTAQTLFSLFQANTTKRCFRVYSTNNGSVTSLGCSVSEDGGNTNTINYTVPFSSLSESIIGFIYTGGRVFIYLNNQIFATYTIVAGGSVASIKNDTSIKMTIGNYVTSTPAFGDAAPTFTIYKIAVKKGIMNNIELSQL